MHRRRRTVSVPLDPASVQFDEAHAGQDEGSSTSFSECALGNVVCVEDMFYTWCQLCGADVIREGKMDHTTHFRHDPGYGTPTQPLDMLPSLRGGMSAEAPIGFVLFRARKIMNRIRINPFRRAPHASVPAR
jgi:hypothetical protein